jgi:hypothetical protein
VIVKEEKQKAEDGGTDLDLFGIKLYGGTNLDLFVWNQMEGVI